MKKILSIMIFLAATTVLAKKAVENNPNQPADVYTVCLGDKGHNTGHCSSKMNGYGSACVKAGLLQGHNCFSSVER